MQTSVMPGFISGNCNGNVNIWVIYQKTTVIKPEFYHNLLPKSYTFKIQILELTVFLPDADYFISFSHGSFIINESSRLFCQLGKAMYQ